MKINDYESTTTLTDNDNFVVQTTAGTRKVSASLVRNSGSVGTEITMAEYEALTEEEKLNGTYWITDAEATNPEALKDLDSRVEVLEEEINEVKASLITTYVRFNASTSLWTTDNSKYPIANQFTTVIRNQNTGAIHILWYDNSVSAFRTAYTVSGSAPSNNNFAIIEFFG